MIAAIFGGVLVALASLRDIDLKLNLNFLHGIENNEIDDVLIGLAVIFVGLTVDRIISERRKRRLAEIEAQKLMILKATMRTVQDIVNNFLNNLVLFEMEAKTKVPRHWLDQLDEVTQQTYLKLKALGDVESVQEKPLAAGLGIDYPGRLLEAT
jgi:hypothetical protein